MIPSNRWVTLYFLSFFINPYSGKTVVRRPITNTSFATNKIDSYRNPKQKATDFSIMLKNVDKVAKVP